MGGMCVETRGRRRGRRGQGTEREKIGGRGGMKRCDGAMWEGWDEGVWEGGWGGGMELVGRRTVREREREGERGREREREREKKGGEMDKRGG